MQIGAADWYFVISEFDVSRGVKSTCKSWVKVQIPYSEKFLHYTLTSHQFQNNLSKSCFGKKA